jgi:hypothetical protein
LYNTHLNAARRVIYSPPKRLGAVIMYRQTVTNILIHQQRPRSRTKAVNIFLIINTIIIIIIWTVKYVRFTGMQRMNQLVWCAAVTTILAYRHVVHIQG